MTTIAPIMTPIIIFQIFLLFQSLILLIYILFVKTMTKKLPVLSGTDLIKLLSKKGFKNIHQKGSHVYLSDGIHKISIPLHRELKIGLLSDLIKQAGLTRKEFLNLSKKGK